MIVYGECLETTSRNGAGTIHSNTTQEPKLRVRESPHSCNTHTDSPCSLSKQYTLLNSTSAGTAAPALAEEEEAATAAEAMTRTHRDRNTKCPTLLSPHFTHTVHPTCSFWRELHYRHIHHSMKISQNLYENVPKKQTDPSSFFTQQQQTCTKREKVCVHV